MPILAYSTKEIRAITTTNLKSFCPGDKGIPSQCHRIMSPGFIYIYIYINFLLSEFSGEPNAFQLFWLKEAEEAVFTSHKLSRIVALPVHYNLCISHVDKPDKIYHFEHRTGSSHRTQPRFSLSFFRILDNLLRHTTHQTNKNNAQI